MIKSWLKINIFSVKTNTGSFGRPLDSPTSCNLILHMSDRQITGWPASSSHWQTASWERVSLTWHSERWPKHWATLGWCTRTPTFFFTLVPLWRQAGRARQLGATVYCVGVKDFNETQVSCPVVSRGLSSLSVEVNQWVVSPAALHHRRQQGSRLPGQRRLWGAAGNHRLGERQQAAAHLNQIWACRSVTPDSRSTLFHAFIFLCLYRSWGDPVLKFWLWSLRVSVKEVKIGLMMKIYDTCPRLTSWLFPNKK